MHPILILRYLFFPLHISSLLVIVIFAMIMTASGYAGVLGIAGFMASGSWFFRYGFVLLDDTIAGRREPPILSVEMINPVEQRPFGLFLLLFAFYSATEAARPALGDLAVSVLRIFLLSLVPAMVAAMSVTGRFIHGLNPLTIFGIVARIPAAYLTLLTVLGSLWYIALWLLRWTEKLFAGMGRLESLLPGQVLGAIGMSGAFSSLVALMIFMYLWLAMFASIGGTIYERRKELEVDAEAAPERAAARVNAEVERERDKIMDRIFAEVRGGAFAAAGLQLRKLIEEAKQPLDECRWVYVRAAATTDQRLAGYVAQLTLPLLLSQRHTSEALKIVRERLAATPDFRPLTAGQLLQLAQLARDAGDRNLARRLLADFDKHYPLDPLRTVAAKQQAELAR